MFKQKGSNKKPTCQDMYQGVTLAGGEGRLRKSGLCVTSEKCQKSFELANKIKANVKKA